MSRPRTGFSIVELVMVVVIIAIAAVAIGSGFASVSRSLALNEDVQRTAQVAHECAEHILSRARPPRGHYAAIALAAPSAECNGMAVPGFNRLVNVNPGAVGALCTAGWNCKWVEIRVTKGSAVANVNFMIIQY
jgi:prepilin-type N-terminal cleavage/methylation domain-containing protein